MRATRDGEGTWRLRLHRFFATAPEQILLDLATWLRSGRRARAACERLDAHIDACLAELPARPKRGQTLSSSGTAHDLNTLVGELLAGPFAGDFSSTPPPWVTWGRRGRSRARHTLRLGTYTRADHLVRIHPVLDRSSVPAWFVSFVLHHELLHAALDQGRSNDGHRIHHGPRFRERERTHRDYTRALAWEKKNLPRLIRAARAGTVAGSSSATAPGATQAAEPAQYRPTPLTRLAQSFLFPRS
ncbi:MAG: hypothetical protein CMK00_02560 [Planctomycetes bacterium]|nr:hypothetical protein [Planctomycetota bacterium]HJO25627.1 hypothetical protein [Planctomycetota bacterium]